MNATKTPAGRAKKIAELVDMLARGETAGSRRTEGPTFRSAPPNVQTGRLYRVSVSSAMTGRWSDDDTGSVRASRTWKASDTST